MFKYGIDLIREYVKETRDKLSDMFCNEEIDFESAKEREAVLCALQLTACLEKENDGMFIVGIETPAGSATYHYDIDPYWDMFDVKELERAPKFDGHTPNDAIGRISSLRRL